MFAHHGDEFSLAIFVVLGDGIKLTVILSLSYEEPGRVLIWDFQHDSYVSVSCQLGLLDYYWIPSSTWWAFLMVDCVLARELTPLGGLTHEFSARLASTL